MPLRFFCSLMLILCLACESQPRQTQAGSAPATAKTYAPFEPHADRLQVGERYYRVMDGEIETGTMRVSVFEEADSWLLEEYTTLELAKIREIVRTRLTLSSLQPIANEVRGTINGQLLNVNVSWAGNHIEGFSEFPRPTQKPQGRLNINADLPAGTLERTSTFYLLPTLNLEDGTEMRFSWFNSLYAQLDPIHLRVTGSVSITVPAGTFDCYRVELLGGDPSQVVYISKTTPRQLVRIEVVDMPWYFELL